MNKVDFLIVGQGIAGSLLAIELIKRGKKIAIFNDELQPSSSQVAAGLYNPITGRNMVKTWMADEIFPKLGSFYENLERELGSQFHVAQSIYRPFITLEEQNDWYGKYSSPTFKPYVLDVSAKSLYPGHVSDEFGGVHLNKCGYVDVENFVLASRKMFTTLGVYNSQMFDHQALEELGDKVVYGGYEAKKIIFCEGPGVKSNPFFQDLRMKPVKGEIIDIETEFSLNQIINRGVFIIPKKDFFTVGSTYDHSDLSWEPTIKGLYRLEGILKKVYKGTYNIKRHRAGIRPSTFDRRPFVGVIKNRPMVGIFNGLGAKGVTLGPYFARVLADSLINNKKLMDEVRLDR